MKRPKGCDVWDGGVEFKRNNTLTEDQRQEELKKLVEEVKESVKKSEATKSTCYHS